MTYEEIEAIISKLQTMNKDEVYSYCISIDPNSFASGWSKEFMLQILEDILLLRVII